MVPVDDRSSLLERRGSTFALLRSGLRLDSALSKDDKKRSEKVQLAAKQSTDDAYALACVRNPKLEDVESYPRRFLSAAKDDEALAAAGLAKQWELRRKVVGDEKLAHPLTMTGSSTSAFSKQDRTVFLSGFLAVLPSDTSGRPVLRYDSSRLEQDFTSEEFKAIFPSIRRCIYYIMSVLSEDAATARDGITVLMVYHSSFSYDDSFESQLQEMLRETMSDFPFSSSSRVEAFCQPPRRHKSTYLDHTVTKLFSTIEKCHEETPCTLTCASLTDQILKEMQNRGFKKEGLPGSMGGEWNQHRDFQEWHRQRNVTEQLKEAYVAFDSDQAMTLANDVLRRDASQKRKREQDQEYARKKRERDRQAATKLRHQAYHLRCENEKLEEEGKRLALLLVKASKTVKGIESPLGAMLIRNQFLRPQPSTANSLTLLQEPQIQQVSATLLRNTQQSLSKQVYDIRRKIVLAEQIEANRFVDDQKRRLLDARRRAIREQLNISRLLGSVRSLPVASSRSDDLLSRLQGRNQGLQQTPRLFEAQRLLLLESTSPLHLNDLTLPRSITPSAASLANMPTLHREENAELRHLYH